MRNESSREIVIRYLEDAIAAERTFEDRLRTFSSTQRERLESLLSAIGGSPSLVKSALAHMFAFAPATEKSTKQLMMAYAVENAEIAMYEAFAVSAETAGDQETAGLMRQIQEEERRTAERVWALLPLASRQAFNRLSGRDMVA